MKSYNVVKLLVQYSKQYSVGEIVTLSDEDARPLLAQKIITPIGEQDKLAPWRFLPPPQPQRSCCSRR